MSLAKKEKLLIVIRNPVGGIRTYFKYVYTDKSLFNYDFSIVCASDDEGFYGSVLGNRLKKYNAVASNIALFFSTLFSTLTNRPAFVHSHGLTSALVVSPILFILRIRHIITLHDVFVDSHFASRKGRLKWLIINMLFQTDCIINPCGRDTERNLLDYFPSVHRKKIHTIQNGISVDNFYINAKRDLHNELSLNEGHILLGFMGRFMRQKGFDLLIEAIRNLNSTNIKVICFGWGGFIREEQAKIAEYGLRDSFYFLPHTDNVAESLRGLDLLVVPSRWEACPLLPMEAFVAGVPFVASDCIGLKEVAEGSPAVLFSNGNKEQLQACIVESIANLSVLTEKFELYRKTGCERFSSTRVGEQLSALYVSILE